MTTNPKLNKEAKKEVATVNVTNRVKHLFSSPFYKKKFEVRYQSSTNGNTDGEVLTIRQFAEGFTSFEKQDYDTTDYTYGDYWMDYSFRKLSVTNPDHTRPTIPELDRKKSRSMRKGVLRSMRAWDQFMKNGDDIFCEFEGYSLSSKLSSDVSTMSAAKDRREYYIPLAFKEGEKTLGGVYANFGIVEGQTLTDGKRPLVTEKPIKEIFTGSCMFGATLYGIDQHGNQYSLTCPRYELPEDSVIQKIISTDTLHPDEVTNQKMLTNLVPFFKIACQTSTPSINYHLPVPNYIIYGLNTFLKGQMSKKALDNYIQLVIKRGQAHQQFLNDQAKEHDLKIRTSSTLSPLELESGTPETTLNRLLCTVGLPTFAKETHTRQDLDEIRPILLQEIVKFLVNQPGEIGLVWSEVQLNINSGSYEFNKNNTNSLMELNYIDYCANLATSVTKYSPLEVCEVFSAQESPIQLTYKKLFASKFGAIMFVNWISPILVKNHEIGHRIFFNEDFVDEINQVIDAGIIEQCLQQTAAIALDEPQMAGQAALKAQAILSEHEMKVQLDEQISQLAQLTAS